MLDYGTGEGKYLHLIRKARPKARLVGIDIRDPHSGADFEFHRVGPGEPLPFAADSFDLVVSCDVLEHVGDLESSLDEIRRALRPGGLFVGFVPVEGGPGPHAFFRMLDPNIYRDTKDHPHAYRRSDMVARLSARFQVRELAYSYHAFGATFDAVFFASFKAAGIGPRMEEFWRGQENAFYRRQAREAAPSLVGSLARLASLAAYWEARLLRKVPLGAKGLHFCLEKR